VTGTAAATRLQRASAEALYRSTLADRTGYTPDRTNDSGKFHRIKLTVKNQVLTVRTRTGYYSQ